MDRAPHTIPLLRHQGSWRRVREFLTVAEAPCERHRRGTEARLGAAGWQPAHPWGTWGHG